MPVLTLCAAPGVTAGVNYNAQTGKVTSLDVTNTTGQNVRATATLTDSRTFGQVFGQGTTAVNFPNNVVSVVFQANGDIDFVGLASLNLAVPA